MQTYDDPEETDNYLLPDLPSKLPKQDTFGHRQYVDTLDEIVREVDPPWQIGIFGQWGTGKSTILGELERKLQEHDGTVMVEFDAWRHAEESVRTDLLLTIDHQLGEELSNESEQASARRDGLLGEEWITKQLYDVEEVHDPIRIRPPGWLPDRLIPLESWRHRAYRWFAHKLSELKVVLIATALLLGGAWILTTRFQIDSAIAVAIGIIAASAPYIVQKFAESEATQRRLANPRKEWSGAYERIFDELLGEFTESKDRLVIAIDNLDRCESDVVYDVLVSLKTFMGKDPCVYVIPCDHRALRDQVNAIQGAETRGWSEYNFLRKFFQTTIRIPPFESSNMEQFAEDQQDRLEDAHRLDDDVASVLAKGRVQTPRRIKHGLNRVVTLKALGEHLEGAELLSQGQISSNQGFLAKIVILEEDFPEFFELLTDDHELLQTATKFATGDISEGDLPDELDVIFGAESEVEWNRELTEFLKETRDYTVDNPRPFFLLSDPQYSDVLTTHEEFRTALREHDVAAVEEELTDLGDESDVEEYLTVLEDTILRDRDDQDRVWNVVATAVEAFPVLANDLKPQFVAAVHVGLEIEGVRARFGELDSAGILEIAATTTDPPSRRDLYARYIGTLVENDQFRATQFEAFVSHTEPIWTGERVEAFDPPDDEQLGRVSQTIRDLEEMPTAEADESGMTVALRKLKGNPETADRLLDDETMSAVVETVLDAPSVPSPILEAFLGVDQNASIDQRDRVLAAVLDGTSVADPEAVDEVVHLLSGFSTPRSEEPQVFSTDAVDRLFRELEPVVTDLPIDEFRLVEFPIKFYAEFGEETRGVIRELLVEIIGLPDDHAIASIVQWVDAHDSEVFEERTIAEAYLNGIPEEFNEVDSVLTAVGHIGVENDDLIADRVLRILDEHDEGEFLDLAFRIFEEYHDWLEGVREEIVAHALTVTASATPKEQHRGLQAVGTVADDLEDEQKELFIERLQTLIREPGRPEAHESFATVVLAVEENLSTDERESLVRLANERMVAELEAGRLPDPKLEEFVYAYHDDGYYTHPDEREAVIEAISAQLATLEIESEADEERQIRLVQMLLDLPTYADMEDRVLAAVEAHRDLVAGLVPNENLLADLESTLQEEPE